MELKLIQINGETILPVTFYGKNRDSKVLEYQQKVFARFNTPINYLEWPFSASGHGDAVQYLVDQTINSSIDYYLFIDMDAIATRPDFINIIYNKISDKQTVFGPAWTSNHRSPLHIHAGGCFMAFARQLYIDCERPALHDRIQRSDNFEEFSWVAAEKGYGISLVYPRSFTELTDDEAKNNRSPKYWDLGQKFKWGLGTQYSDLFFHCGLQGVPRSSEIFIQKCEEVLNPKIEAIIVCKDYSDYLYETLLINKGYFDAITVITSKEDHLTQQICNQNKINCVIYEGFNKNGARFNFGGARQFGLDNRKFNEWVCFLDSDIVVRQEFKHLLIDKNKFYGSYRRFIPNVTDYTYLLKGEREQEGYTSIVGQGVGFFQCFNLNNTKIKQIGIDKIYNDSNSAEEVDIIMLKKFCPLVENDSNLINLNIELWHLGDQPGLNNSGRSEKDSFFDV